MLIKEALKEEKNKAGFLLITERCVIAPLDLLQFIFVAQCKQRPLDVAHFLHFAHHILVDAIHNFLKKKKKKSLF